MSSPEDQFHFPQPRIMNTVGCTGVDLGRKTADGGISVATGILGGVASTMLFVEATSRAVRLHATATQLHLDEDVRPRLHAYADKADKQVSAFCQQVDRHMVESQFPQQAGSEFGGAAAPA